MKRFLCLTAVAGLAAALLFGVAGPAAADTATDAGIVYTANPADPGAGAEVTGYSGAGGAVVIPDTIVVSGVRFEVTQIGDAVFNGVGATSVMLGKNVALVGVLSFANNSALTSVHLDSSLVTVESLAFTNDAALTSIVIPNSVTTIGDGAFSGDTDLASVDFGDGITTIGDEAFASCPLTSITLPASLTTVIEYAFFNNPALTDVYLLGPPPTVAPAGPAGASFGDTDTVPTIHYDLAFANPPDVTGYTSGAWQGYPTQAFASVSFDLRGHGAAIATQRIDPGDPATEPSAPTASGWKFTGWYTTAALATKADFADPIATDTTLFAGWAARSSAGPALALTGGTINPVFLPIAAAALIIGLILVIVAARRRRARRRH